jgi:hypothetical protein
MTRLNRLCGIVVLIVIAAVSIQSVQVHWGFDLTIERDHRDIAIPLNVMIGWLSIGVALVLLLIEGCAYIRRRFRNE